MYTKRIYPQTKFIVLSDNHFYDSSLGTSGRAFEQMITRNKDVKLLLDSKEILQSVIKSILVANPDFVIICGDLTKDGETASHLGVIKELNKLRAAGIPVYVINGNHDIQNDNAFCYTGNRNEKVSSISGNEFRELYSSFGYQNSLAQDRYSLSYVAEPVEGLWLLVMDSCIWQYGFRVGGRFNKNTLSWLERVLKDAQRRKKSIIGMMHHGILEHYPGNKKFYRDYIIANNEQISKLFADYDLNIVFTGHFHCQDIACQTWNNDKYLYDIETGALVTYPCAYRVITIDSTQYMVIKSKRVQSTKSYPRDFPNYAYNYSYRLTAQLVHRTLRSLLVSEEDIKELTPQIIAAYCSHCVGNEMQHSQEVIDFSNVSWWGRKVIGRKTNLLKALWENDGPPDNNLVINLQTGKYFSN